MGPTQVNICSGSVHRINTIERLSSFYDYPPYVGDDTEPQPDSLNLPTKEEIDQLENNTPTKTLRVTVLHPSLTITSADHCVSQLSEPVKLEAGVRCVDLVIY